MAAPTIQLSLDGLAKWGIASVHPATRGGDASSGSDHRANGLAFSDNGRFMFSSHNDGAIHVHNGESGSREATLLSREYGCKMITATHHEQCVLHASNGAKLDSPYGGQVAYHSLYDNKVVRFFRSGTPASVSSISINPLSDWFISTYTDGTFRLWDLRTPNCQASGAIEAGEGAYASFDYGGRCFAVATPSRGIALYDVQDFKRPAFDSTRLQLLEFTVKPEPMPGLPQTPPRYPSRVTWTSLDFSPDERFIALGTADRGVLIVDAFHLNREYALLNAHPIDPQNPAGVSWSPDGRFLAVGGADGHIYCYDLEGKDKFGREGQPGGLPPTGSDFADIKKLPSEWCSASDCIISGPLKCSCLLICLAELTLLTSLSHRL